MTAMNDYQPPVVWKKDLDGISRRWIRRLIMVNVVYLIIMFSGISGITWLGDLFPDGLRIGILKSVSSKESKIRELERTLKRFRLKEEIYHIVKGNGISVGQAMGIAESVLIQCETLQLPPELILAVMAKETNHNPVAVSSKGAMGIMQIMPATWDEYVKKLDLGVSRQAAFDPVVNITIGAHIVKDLYDLYKRKTKNEKETWTLTLSAYYSGPSDVAQRGLRSGHEKYVSDIFENQRRYAQRLKSEEGMLD
jgi:hypothetical protein